jgi:2-polyprenyl-6-methoxyphenol hydroxylase-like FAD-dependent oxidoreductase
MTQAITKTKCCIAGGGPAGMMAGWLLARAGVDVIVLEKHADFFRDFRGDTIHPSTLELMHELGVLDDFLKRPHQELREIALQFGDKLTPFGDFTHLPTVCKFLVLMPQWDFLNFVAEQAKRYPAFHLEMETAVTQLVTQDNRIAGVRTTSPRGEQTILADLVLGADGRSSIVREQAGLQIQDFGAPIDVLWFPLSHKASDQGQPLGRVNNGSFMVMFDRAEYWQCAFVIHKGGFDEMRSHDIAEFREKIATLMPFMRDRVDELKSWEDVKLLTVKVDRLTTWHRPGLLCIGDSAHAMSPVGGVGINLAIQDAVATANILAAPLAAGTVTEEQLHAVQRRREFPTRITQRVQVFAQDNIISRALTSTKPVATPWPLRILGRFRFLRGLPARAVGIGVRAEHIHTPDTLAS